MDWIAAFYNGTTAFRQQRRALCSRLGTYNCPCIRTAHSDGSLLSVQLHAVPALPRTQTAPVWKTPQPVWLDRREHLCHFVLMLVAVTSRIWRMCQVIHPILACSWRKIAKLRPWSSSCVYFHLSVSNSRKSEGDLHEILYWLLFLSTDSNMNNGRYTRCTSCSLQGFHPVSYTLYKL
jgi:hypothetical protein